MKREVQYDKSIFRLSFRTLLVFAFRGFDSFDSDRDHRSQKKQHCFELPLVSRINNCTAETIASDSLLSFVDLFVSRFFFIVVRARRKDRKVRMDSKNKVSTRSRNKLNTSSTSTSTSYSGNGDSYIWKYKKEIRHQVNQNKTKNEHYGVLKGFKYDYRSGGGTTQIEDYVEVTKKIVSYACLNCYMFAVWKSIMNIKLSKEFIIPQPNKDIVDDDEVYYTKEALLEAYEQKIINKVIKEIYEENLIKFDTEMIEMYAIIYGQCTYPMKQKLRSHHKAFKSIDNDSDTIGLLKLIKSILYSYESVHPYRPLAILHSLERFFSFEQTKHMSNNDYLIQFKKNVMVVKVCCGDDYFSICIQKNLDDATESLYGPTIVKYDDLPAEDDNDDDDDDNDDQKQQRSKVKKATSEMLLANAFIRNSDQDRFERLLHDLHFHYLCKQDCYPKTLSDAYQLLENYE